MDITPSTGFNTNHNLTYILLLKVDKISSSTFYQTDNGENKFLLESLYISSANEILDGFISQTIYRTLKSVMFPIDENKEIRYYPFTSNPQDFDLLTSIVFPEGTKFIGGKFTCYNLNGLLSIRFPSSLEEISTLSLTSYTSGFFDLCTSLTMVDFSECSSLTAIHSPYMFTRNTKRLDELALPSSIVEIDYPLVELTSNLSIERISLPLNLPIISGNYIFSNTKSNSPISVGTTIFHFPSGSYSKLTSLTDIELLCSALTGPPPELSAVAPNISSLTLPSISPNGFTIPTGYFSKFGSLVDLMFSVDDQSLDRIGLLELSSCRNIYLTINLKEGDTNSKTFGLIVYNVPSLRSLTFSPGVNIASFNGLVFYNCSSLLRLDLSSVTDPSVTTLPQNIFYGCSSLTSLSLPVGLSSLDCSYLGLDSAKNLLNINIPNGVLSITDGGLSTFSKMVYIDIPDACLSLGNNIFYDSSNIIVTKFDCWETIKYIGDGVFANSNFSPYDILNCMPSEGFNLSSIEHIGASAFYRTNLEYITLPGTTFGNKSFAECLDLKEVKFTSTSLTKSNISDSLVLAGSNNLKFARFNCTLALFMENSEYTYLGPPISDIRTTYNELNSILGIDSPVITYVFLDIEFNYDGAYWYYDCFEYDQDRTILYKCYPNKEESFRKFCLGLDNKTPGLLPISVRQISSLAFQGASNSYFTQILFLKNLSEIGDNAFLGCTNLKTIIFDGCDSFFNPYDSTTLSSIGATSVLSVELLNDITRIPPRFFASCPSLSSIRLSNTINYIGSYAFAGTAISSINILTYNSNDIPCQFVENCFKDAAFLTAVKFEYYGSTFILETIAKLKSYSSSDSSSNHNEIGLNTWAVLYSNEHPSLDYPTFVVVPDYEYSDEMNGQLVGPTEPTLTYIKFLPKGIKVSTNNGELLGIDLLLISHTGHLPDDLLWGLGSIAPSAFQDCTKLRSILIPETLSSNVGENAFISSNKTPYDLSVKMEWCTGETYETSPYLSNATDLWGLSSNFKSCIILKDRIVYYDGSYRSRYNDMSCYVVYTDINSNIVLLKYNPELDPLSVGFHGIDLYLQLGVTIIAESALAKLLTSNSHLSSVNLENVVEVGDRAFFGSGAISDITNTSDISSIGIDAFAYSGISSFQFSDKIESIGQFGVNLCPNLTQIEFLGTGPTKIGDQAFMNATKLNIVKANSLNKLESIGNYAFYNTLKLDTFECLLNVKLKELGAYSFFKSSLKNVPKIDLSYLTSKTVSNYAFLESYIKNIDLTNISCVGIHAFYKSSFDPSFTLSNTTFKWIEDEALALPNNEFNIALPSSIEYIATQAFRSWKLADSNLSTISIDIQLDELSTLNPTFLAYNEKLPYYSNIWGLLDSTIISCLKDDYYSGHALVYNNKLIPCPPYLSIDVGNRSIITTDKDKIGSTIYIPEYVKSVAPSAFADCTSVTDAYVSENLLMAEYLFAGDINILTLTFNDSMEQNGRTTLTSVYTAEFMNCKSINGIIIDDSVTDIPASAFYNCLTLTSDIGIDSVDDTILFLSRNNSISSCGDYCFAGCKSFTVLNFSDSITEIGQNILSGCTSLSLLNIDLLSAEFISRIKTNPDDSLLDIIEDKLSTGNTYFIQFKDGYCVDSTTGKEFINGINISNGIIDAAYTPRVYLTDITLPEVSSINDYVFTECDFLRSMKLYYPEALSGRIGDYAFYNCTKLKTIFTDDNELYCSELGRYAFYNCRNLTKITFNFTGKDADLCHIGRGAFYGSSVKLIYIKGTTLDKFKTIIGWSRDDRNPLLLMESCTITFVPEDSDQLPATYDYILNDMTNRRIYNNPNTMVYTDKTTTSVKAVLVVPAIDDDNATYSTALMTNTFHCNIIGRWK